MTATAETVNRGVQRLHAAFARAGAEGRAAFIPFMTGGYPHAARFLDVAGGMLSRPRIIGTGGIPSAPRGDGPPHKRGSEAANAGGSSPPRTPAAVSSNTLELPAAIYAQV